VVLVIKFLGVVTPPLSSIVPWTIADRWIGIVPVNPWPPSKHLQKQGSMMAMNINIILEPMSMPIFTEVLGWSPDALESLLDEVRKEIADLKMHAYMTLYAAFPSHV
jgi:hypothetical protein